MKLGEMNKYYRWWEIVETLPEGWRVDYNAGSPLHGHVFIINGSPIKGGKRALLRGYPQKNSNSNSKE